MAHPLLTDSLPLSPPASFVHLRAPLPPPAAPRPLPTSLAATAVRDRAEAWERHIGDSLALLPILDKHLRQQHHQQQLKIQRQAARAAAQASSSSSAPSLDGGLEGSRPRQRTPRPRHGGEASTGAASPEASGFDPATAPLSVIDVGTGAGLPGMVLAVVRPQWKVGSGQSFDGGPGGCTLGRGGCLACRLPNKSCVVHVGHGWHAA